MRIERYRPQRATRRKSPAWPCACLTMFVIGVMVAALSIVLIIPLVNRAALGAAGLEASGSTDAVFNQAGDAPPLINNAVPAGGVQISAGTIGTVNLNQSGAGYSVETGQDVAGQVMQAMFNEDALLNLCHNYGNFCNANGDPLRNARFDLKPGGGIIRGEFFVEALQVWQPVNIVMQLAENNRVQIAGVDSGGVLYTAPPNESMGVLFNEAEVLVNQLLSDLTAQAGGTLYTLDSIYTDETTLTVILR